ncbi:condensation domain-containing protein [Micromonospora orduensis]|nr:condensation domain-containing protein [Micromonospora orduensis]
MQELTPGPADAAAIVREILAVHLAEPTIGLDDDFYAMGGDSLIALRVVADAQARGIEVTLRDLLYNSTVRALVAALDLENAPEDTPAKGPDVVLLPAVDHALLPAGVVSALPATKLQVGMIYLSERSGDRELYQSMTGWLVPAAFDEASFRTALRRLIERHDALRSSFDFGGLSVPAQLIWSAVESPLTIRRMAGATPAELTAAAHRWHQHDLDLPLDYERAPLFRCHVAVGGDAFHVTLVVHHAIIDGWSLGQVLVDLLTLYAQGDHASLPPVPDGVAGRFLESELAALADPVTATFWRNESNVPPLLTGGVRPTGVANADVTIETALDTALVDDLRAVARTLELPLKSLLFGAHLRALGELAGRSDDIVSGLVVNTRPQIAGSDLFAGLFLNTVPIRVDSVRGTWAELCRRGYAAERRAAPYLAYPLGQIEVDLNRPPFDVVFNFTNFHVYQQARHLGGPAPEGFWVRGKPSFPFRVDVDIDGVQSGSRLVVAFDPAVVADRDARAYVARMADALTELATDPLAVDDRAATSA